MRKHTAAEKGATLRRHLVDKVPLSELCEEKELRYGYLRLAKEFFENGAAAFESKQRPSRQVAETQKRIEFLQKKVQKKDKKAILQFHRDHPLEGYRLAFMMLGANVVAVSPASAWRVLLHSSHFAFDRVPAAGGVRSLGWQDPFGLHD